MVLAPPKPQKAQQTTTPPKSNNYWNEPKQLSPQLSKNSKQSVNPPARPYKQVCFLLHPCQKERHQLQSHLKPEPRLPVYQHQRPVPPNNQYKLHCLSQLHHSHLQAIHHLTYQLPQPWLNRTNPEFWVQPQTHMIAPLRRPSPFGIPSPTIMPSMMVFIPPMPRRSHLPLSTLR